MNDRTKIAVDVAAERGPRRGGRGVRMAKQHNVSGGLYMSFESLAAVDFDRRAGDEA